jgi:signal peptidase I
MAAKTGDNGDFFDKIQTVSEFVLTWRKQRKRIRIEKQKAKNFIVDWVEAFFWAVGVVLLINQYFFQAYQIPSGSMIDTLLVGDRIFVNKFVYGPELLPGLGKFKSPVIPNRNDVIIFESPEYLSRGPVFDLAQRIIYMLTISLVDIDKDENGNPKAHFLIKRAVGMPGDRIFNNQGDMLFRFKGEVRDVKETDYNIARGWKHNLNRLILPDVYPHLIDAAEHEALLYINGETSSVTIHEETTYKTVYYETLRGAFPHEERFSKNYYRLVMGWYVPEGRRLPLGDNRDNSRDGRYFGPVKESKILGSGLFIYWPGRTTEIVPTKAGLARIGLIK